MNNEQPGILVIGAGIAGLACAQSYLTTKGKTITLVEASDKFGGRIQSDNSFGSPVELGGEAIYDTKNLLYKLIKSSGIKMENDDDSDDYIYDPLQNKLITLEKCYKRYPKLDCRFHNYKKPDCSIMEVINEFPQFLHYFKSVFGAEYGSILTNLSARGVQQTDDNYQDDDLSYTLQNTSLTQFISNKFKEAINIIQYKQIVTKIDYTNPIIQVTIYDDNTKETKVLPFTKVVCTLPITQISKIEWVPELSKEKQEQFKLVGMSKGGKLIIQMNKLILPKDCDGIIIELNHTGAYWNNSNGNQHFIIGLIAEDGHQLIKEMGEQQFIQKVIDEINKQCKTNGQVVSHKYQNWGDTPYIEGLYSYPKVGAATNYRKIISQQISNRIYFAGEAYHERQYQSMQGAYETGIRVAEQL